MMDIQSLRELLRQGETGKTLTGFIAYLQQDARYKDNLLRTLQVLESKYNAVRQKELKGILTFQEAQREYNETTDALLALLDEVEAGRVPAPPIRPVFRNMVMAAFAGGMLLLAVFVLFKAFGKKAPDCPAFDRANTLHVLVLPFDRLGDKSAPVELRIQESISTLTQKAKIPVQVAVSPQQENSQPSLQVAERLGQACGADLVIYGMYKAFDSGDSLRVNMGFKYLKAGGEAGSIPFKTFRDITDVTATRDLEDALFSICAMIAVSDKNWDAAKRWMDKIKDKEDNEEKMAAWLAAKKSGQADQ